MANLGSIAAVIADINQKVTANGNAQNTGTRVNLNLNNIIDTLTDAPVTGGNVVGVSVFASAAQGQLAATALQPGDNVSELVNDAGYLTSAPSTLTGNLAYVDAVTGNDATGAVGDFTLPYATLLAAQTAAPSGTTIVVRPGAYTSAPLGKNGVNWYFTPGATVNFTGTGWRVLTTNVAYKVRGSGVFNCVGIFAQATLADANIDIECDDATYTRIDITTGTISIKVKGIATSSQESSIFGGSLTFSANRLVSNVSTRVFSVLGGTVNINDTYIQLTGTGGSFYKPTGTGFCNLTNVFITGGAGVTFTTQFLAEFFCQNVVCNTSASPIGADITIRGNLQVLVGAPATVGEVPVAFADGSWGWDAVAAPAPSVLTGNLAYVDAVNGDNGTGTLGDFTKPFLTLQAAQTAASSGTTIVVRPGTYSAALLGKNGVNWYFMPGATVNFSTNSAFAASGAMSYSVFGYGVFTVNGWLARLDSPASNVYIECQSVESTIGFQVVQTTSTLQIVVRTTWSITLNNVGSGVLNSGSTAYVKARRLTISAGTTIPFVVDGATTIEVDTLTCTGTPLAMFSLTGGNLTLVRSRITAVSLTGPVILQEALSGSQVTLLSTVIQGSNTQDTIEGGADGVFVISQASQVVEGLGSNVTVLGNLQVGYLTPAGVGEVPTANADGTWSWA
jgi:hypothetical protein